MGRKLLLEHINVPGINTLKVYREKGGYRAVEKAIKTMSTDEVVEEVKKSGLRGRGGAGFPTGMKWSFLAKPEGVPRYLVCNADESEPGTFKDRYLMTHIPHALIEGMIVSSYALGANTSYIYVRGEMMPQIRILEKAIAEAKEAGFLGKNILGSGYDLELYVQPGGGAYICGEETALLDSLEGRRGQPRLKPPFPAVAGLYASPTVVNNAETLASVPSIILNGADWFKSMGTEKSSGFKLFAVSGHVNRPGIFEAALGTTMSELLDYAGGMRKGSKLKFWIPGGSSVPMLTPDHIDIPMTYEDLAAAGTMLGTGTPMMFDHTTSVVKAVTRWLEFYKHESCGKCTPCREGTYWITGVLEKFEHGKGKEEELEVINDVCGQIAGRSFCALGDAAATPFPGAMKYFADEFREATRTSADASFPPSATTIFDKAGV